MMSFKSAYFLFLSALTVATRMECVLHVHQDDALPGRVWADNSSPKLEPLLHPIQEDRTTVVWPIIDIVDDHSLQYKGKGAEYLMLGGFNWKAEFVWINLPSG
ncbi:hypothetical protein HPB47_017965 [Ixodes persulcatus]|uniref:Uncharacterized protein n=1 Tax=Ixodes persulcatus TaxID=34615 RepID=A0AC60QMX4_IXOPE|nr:hypothetical protein HPB47_017965 [Ixodes persulcatus]